MNEITLKIAEIPKQHVGRGRALVDPKFLEDTNWTTGQILELTFNKKTHVKLWPGNTEDYGSGLVRIDGVTRQNIGAGIDDKIKIKSVEAVNAEQITISPTEKINVDGLEDYMRYNYQNHVFTSGDTISLNTQMGTKIQFVITSTKPSKPVIVTDSTIFKLGEMTKSIDSSIPRITYDELGGLKNEVQKIREMVELPMRHPELFEKIGVDAPKGVLLYGPPGTGKTLIAKALAKMTDSNFISVKGPELLSKWVGESEKGVREIFRKARQASPCIIFFDEIDSLVPRRSASESSHVSENVVSQILTEIDGLEELHDVLIIGATNRLDIVDEALLRPGRFDRIIEVPKPDAKGREHILKIHTKNKPLDKNINLKNIIELTEGFSGAEISAIANNAAILAMKRYVNGKSQNVKDIKITEQDLLDAVKKIQPKITEPIVVSQTK